GDNNDGRCAYQHGIYVVGGTGGYAQNNVIFEVWQGFAFHLNATINHWTITNNTIFNGGDTKHNSGGPFVFTCYSGTCDYNNFSNNIMANMQSNSGGFGCMSEDLYTGATGSYGTHNVYSNNLT